MPAAVPRIPSLHTPLIGRADGFALLHSAWDDVVAGHGRIVFINGEAGIGKTRLVSEFATSVLARAHEESNGKGIRILAGGGQAGETKTPYFPLLSALRASMTSVDWQTLSSRLDDLWLTECARVLPEIRAHRRDLPRPSTTESRFSRAQLFEALTRLFLAFDPSLLLFLDDMQWADGTTLAWLGTLARRIVNERILLILAYRNDALMPDLARLREAVGRMGISLTISLNRLSVQEVTELVRQLSRQTDGAVLFSRRLHGETDGNPFFLLETLRTLFDQAVVRRTADGWETDWDEVTRDYGELPLPESVRTLLASRLRALSPTARQIADVAAVVGPTFDPVLVWRASGRSEEEVADGLDQLVARQIVRETQLLTPLPSAVERYAFTHDKLQEEAYHELSSARRRLLHRRVGEALAILDPNAVIALARHFELARDWTRAAIYALRAGQGARGVFAHSEARIHFERTLHLLRLAEKNLPNRKEHAANQRMRLEALDGRGWVLRLLGEMDAYARDLDEVASLARELGDRRSQARASWRQAYAALWFCRYDQVSRAAREGITLSRAIGDLETEMECVWTMALAARATGDYASARRGLERAWTFFSSQRNPVAQVHLLSHLSTLNLYEKRYHEAECTARQALALCDQERLAYHRRLPLGDLGALAAEKGDAEQACAYLLESLSTARQIADRTQEIFCLGHLGWLSVRLKSAGKAREYFTDALRVAHAVGSRTEQSWLYAGWAEAQRLCGDSAQARDAAQRALAIAEQSGQKRDWQVARKLAARL
jgi:tetratricopeptide (TPR) repeat protein